MVEKRRGVFYVYVERSWEKNWGFGGVREVGWEREIWAKLKEEKGDNCGWGSFVAVLLERG